MKPPNDLPTTDGMMCARCRREMPEGRYCAHCGEPRFLACGACGAELGAEFRFCRDCGAGIPSPPVSESASPVKSGRGQNTKPQDIADGEARQISVLSCELRLRTLSSGDPGDEAAYRALRHFRRISYEVVERYGGLVSHFLGSTLTAFFGAPTPFEDHQERAMLAALELQGRLDEYSVELAAKHGLEWAAAVGLDSGPAVLGGDLVVGAAIGRASQLGRHAASGEVLAGSALAQRLSGRFQLQHRAEIPPLDGGAVDAKEKVFRALGRPTPSQETAGGPFVGRSRELAILLELAARAAQGQGQIVTITGDAGVGKTRIAEELHRSLAGRRHIYLRTRCSAYGAHPFSPFADLIRSSAGIAEGDPPEKVSEKLRWNLRFIGLDGPPPPELLSLLGSARLGSTRDHGASADFDLDSVAEVLCQLLLAAAEQAPVILEIEDLEWLDAGAQEVLSRLSESLAKTRFMLLMTYRSGRGQGLASLLARPNATQIALQPLVAAESRQLASSLLGAGQDPSGQDPSGQDPSGQDPSGQDQSEVVRAVVDLAEGNALFVHELARGSSQGAGTFETLPETIQGLMMARLGDLPEAEKGLLQIAAVIGRVVPRPLLSAAWPGTGSHEAPLADLRRRGLLQRAGEDCLAFSHGLLQRAVYASLLPRKLRFLHAQIATALDASEAYGAELSEAELAQLAEHQLQAGDLDKSLGNRLRFAKKAGDRGAFEEVATVLAAALETVHELPSDRRRQRIVEILLPLTEALFTSGQLGVIPDLIGRHQAVLDEILEPADAGRFEAWLALSFSYLGRPREATQAAKRANALGRRGRDEAAQGRARLVMGLESFLAGSFNKAKEQSLKAMVLLERAGEPWWQAQAQELSAAGDLMAGQTEAAFEALDGARELRAAIGDSRLSMAWLRAYTLVVTGEIEQASALAKADLERNLDEMTRTLLNAVLGLIHLRSGEAQQAISSLEESAAKLGAMGMRRQQGWGEAWLAQALVLDGCLERARQVTFRSEELLSGLGFALGDAELYRARSRVALASGDTAEARRSLEEAHAVWEKIGYKLEEVATALELAHLADS